MNKNIDSVGCCLPPTKLLEIPSCSNSRDFLLIYLQTYLQDNIQVWDLGAPLVGGTDLAHL